MKAYMGSREGGCLGTERYLTHVLGKHLCLSFHLFPMCIFLIKNYNTYYNNTYALETNNFSFDIIIWQGSHVIYIKLLEYF